MTDTAAPSTSIEAEVAPLVRALQDAWNAGDGAAFSAPLTDDADFVNVYGMHARGRESIAAGHEHIFRTVYAGSRVEYRVESARRLRDDVALVHLHARLSVPAGPMAGVREALPSLVLTREGGGPWRIAAFHNTFIQQPGHAAPNQEP
ncbi:SgcJ/EcaC family oxidoreductase [Longimicrobium sp.]|uniref:SgcJ/EcaC family oxidoreductase n=1 Tax=Longimicrobium sp. TaxID=2029185 RepID=UPI002C719724|nr:SgcJ/EcaC family oxidoreductase [Longimicrobium sp.]HSU13005.1 SgcJ/EcaC family oxidoreductase [Longimicrobium sp.]